MRNPLNTTPGRIAKLPTKKRTRLSPATRKNMLEKRFTRIQLEQYIQHMRAVCATDPDNLNHQPLFPPSGTFVFPGRRDVKARLDLMCAVTAHAIRVYEKHARLRATLQARYPTCTPPDTIVGLAHTDKDDTVIVPSETADSVRSATFARCTAIAIKYPETLGYVQAHQALQESADCDGCMIKLYDCFDRVSVIYAELESEKCE